VFFRRLADGMQTQNWYTVAIELLVLVVGIFLGLRVDDWNQKRLDRNDEQILLNRLHEELLDSIALRAFLRERRIENWHGLRGGLDYLISPDDERVFSGTECRAIYNSHIKTGYIADLPSFRTLVATGRLHIISDEALRATLVRFSQQRETIEGFVDLGGFELGPKHPDFFQVQPFINKADDRNDLDVTVSCDPTAMRASRQFLLELFANADRYDAYMVSGLLPMLETVEVLHELLDQNLAVDHDQDAIVSSNE